MLMLQSAVHFVVQSVVNRLICMCYVIESNACMIGIRGILVRHVGGVHTDSIVACGYVGACGTLLGCAIHGRVESAVVMYLVAGSKGTLGE